MRKREIFSGLLPFFFIFFVSWPALFSQKAYPDAIGFGAKCKGAYAGSKNPRILIVDVLTSASTGDELTGRGSFRWAVTRNYPRVILFEVSGNINLDSKISINNPYITIAGQTAPDPGITIRNYPVIIYTSDVIIQHLRFRLGDVSIGDGSFDTFSVYKGPNTYIDHCTFSWAVDENFSCSSTDLVRNVTISNCIISEALYNTPHPDSPNSYGMLIYKGDSISVLRNLFVHLGGRVPMINNTATNVLIANNLLYNTGISNSNIYFNTNSVPLIASVIGNKLIRGSQSASVKLIQVKKDLFSGTKIYLKDNDDYGRTSSPWSVVTGDTVKFRSDVQSLRDINYLPISSASLEDSLLPTVGARPFFRDGSDSRIINEVRTRTGKMIDSQEDVGGFPDLANNIRKLQIPVNPHSDPDNDKYTNLEEWLYKLHLELLGRTQPYVSTSQNSPPVIYDQVFTVNDDDMNNLLIGKVVASDPENSGLRFNLDNIGSSKYFEIDPNTGELFKSLIYNAIINDTVLSFSVIVTDNGDPILEGSAKISVYIQKPSLVSVDNPESVNNKLTVFPNPNDGHFALGLNFNSPERIYYEVLNASGTRIVSETLYPQPANSLLDVNLSDRISKGVYLLIVRTGQLLITRKIVIH